MQNNSFQRHGRRWWDPGGSHHPRLGKTLGCQRCQTSRRLGRSETKEAVTDLQHLFWPVGDLLWTRCWKTCLFPQYLHRHGFQRCTVRASELSRSPAEFVATPLHQCVLPSQLWGSNTCTMGSSPIMVASAGPVGSGGWNLPHHNCIPKYTTLCSYCKLHWGFHMLNFQCFVNRNYSQVFQELERSTRLCISLWLRLGNNLTDLDFVNVHNWFFTQNEFISKYNIGLMGLIENSGAFSCSIYLVLTMHVVGGSGYKIGVCEKNYFISPHFQGHL